MKISSKMFLFIATSACFSQTSLQAVDTSLSFMLKTAAALTALSTAGTLLIRPEAPVAFAAGAAAGGILAAGAHYTGRYADVIYDDSTSRRFITATGTVGFGIGAALHNYIPNMQAAGAGYVVTCGALASLSCRRLDNLVDF